MFPNTKPAYDFLYAAGFSHGGFRINGAEFDENGKIMGLIDIIPPIGRIVYYDVDADKGHVISLEEARLLKLNRDVVSPDGFSVVPSIKDQRKASLDWGINSGDALPPKDIVGNGIRRRFNFEEHSYTTAGGCCHLVFLAWVVE